MLIQTVKESSVAALPQVTLMPRRKFLEQSRKKASRSRTKPQSYNFRRSYLRLKGNLSRKSRRWAKLFAPKRSSKKVRAARRRRLPQSAVASFFIVMLATASAVGVLAIIIGTIVQPDSSFDAAFENSYEHRVAPLDLQLQRVNQAARTEVAGKVHFLANYIDDYSRRVNRDEARELAAIIYAEATRGGLDPFLVTSIIQSESAFRTGAQSNKSAYGLMQVQPITAKFTAKLSRNPWKGTSSLLSNKQYNVRIGVAYMNYLLERFEGNLGMALMAYNWGPTNYDLALQRRKRVPSSVRQYAKKIINRHTKFHLSYSDVKNQYQYMNVNFIPETLWTSLTRSS